MARFVGSGADIETKKLQERFNKQSETPVWRRMARGTLPKHHMGHKSHGGLPGLEVWTKLKMPMFLIAGEGDEITKPEEVAAIRRAFGRVETATNPKSAAVEAVRDQDEAKSMAMGINECSRTSVSHTNQTQSDTEITVVDSNHSTSTTSEVGYAKKRQILKTSILPHPASHALLYDSTTYRTLAGLIQGFLSDYVDSRLSLGWQLQHLSTEGKWDVKNLAKWRAVRPVSEPIAGTFRAMKTLREIDDTHSPNNFVKDWKTKLSAVVDISHENPVYDPKGLDQGGIEYHKFPTVSKIPPTEDEVRDFIKLTDKLREKFKDGPLGDALIGVHCHYGFNRTGFFICSYLIEREGYGVQQAIDLFKERRSPGIRHGHFLDTLFVRYCVGLQRSPTL